MSSNWERNYKFGGKWEDEVEKYLKSKGYSAIYCEPNPEYDNRQVIVVGQKDYCHPDFTVGIKENGIFFKKLLVEVKSFTQFYQNRGLANPWEFPQNEIFATVEAFKFHDYQFVADYLDMETRIIFVSEQSPGVWYWDKLDNLKKTAKYAEGIYGKREKQFYLWNIENLKTIKC